MMGETDRSFAGSIPDIYDAYLVPLLFEAYAADLARRAAETEPARVLETAAGTGVVARALAPLLGSHAHYVVSDLNQPMLDRAASRQGPDERIVWRQADALNLPFEDDSFDAVVCQFGAMFFPDRVGAYRETRRVLKQGGRFLFNVWDRIEENEFSRVVTEAVGAIFPTDPPRFLARMPHGYHDLERIELELRTASFSGIEFVTLQKRSAAPSPRHPAIGYCQGTPLRAEIEARDPEGLETTTARVGDAIARAFGKGAVSGKIQAHVIVARA
jgi:ubiquinone/menaquinone biosynthesis C-methylase UbiE